MEAVRIILKGALMSALSVLAALGLTLFGMPDRAGYP